MLTHGPSRRYLPSTPGGSRFSRSTRARCLFRVPVDVAQDSVGSPLVTIGFGSKTLPRPVAYASSSRTSRVRPLTASTRTRQRPRGRRVATRTSHARTYAPGAGRGARARRARAARTNAARARGGGGGGGARRGACARGG